MHASDFAALIPECCSEVLDSMYFVTVSAARVGSAFEPQPGETAPTVAFNLRYSGDCCGQFGISLCATAARSLAANFLGEDESELNQKEIYDVAGELSNMLCGSVMSCATKETKFVLSHPEPGAGHPVPGCGDMAAIELETDLGTIAVWITVEGVPCLS